MAEFDVRIIGMLALALCLLSLTGLIFVRHHHQRNPSVMRLTSSETPVSERDYHDDTKFTTTTTEELEQSSAVINAPSATTLCDSNKTSTPALDSGFHLSEQCLECICHASTECKTSRCAGGELCGVFRISQPYWTDAGSPTLNNEALDTADNRKQAYLHCVNDRCCATRTVKGYTAKYSHDCDGDRLIDCYDYAAIHIQGPTGCKTREMPLVHSIRLDKCLYGLP